MRNALAATLGGLFLLAAFSAARGEQGSDPGIPDSRLRATTETVMKSDRYLHQSKLHRGMKGYGLTVMAGTEIARFDVEIVSVLQNYTAFAPQHDIILARLSGLGLDKTGIIAGMSGSPVYVVDPKDGKEKLIGAVAFGWSFQREPLAGIQPISQMLAGGVPRPEDLIPTIPPAPGPIATQPASLPTSQPASQPVEVEASADGGSSGAGVQASPEWRAAAFNPRKTDFARFGWPKRWLKESTGPQADQLLPLATPLMAGGLCEQTREYLGKTLAGTNMMPVQSGGVGHTAAEEVKGLKLAPGSSIAIPLVTGDEDISAVGTVTDVVDGKVLGFGHEMFGDGAVHFPMATGYVHTVIATLQRSFKLASNVEIVGELGSDEFTGIGGTVGRKVDMIPVSVEVAWEPFGQTQTFHYRLLRDRNMTPVLAQTVTMDSVWRTRNMPQEHSIEYSVAIDFGSAGVYKVDNFSSNNDIFDLASDVTRPIGLMLRNPFGIGRVESIDVKVSIRKGERIAKVLGATLDRNAYAPGEMVSATVNIWPIKSERTTRTIQVKLPDDLPEGKYMLTLGDSETAGKLQQEREPQRFDPRNLAQLLQSVQLAAGNRTDRLYAILEVDGVGMAVEQQTLPDVPPTIAALLKSAQPLEVTPLRNAVTASQPLEYSLIGSTQATVVVTRNPPRP